APGKSQEHIEGRSCLRRSFAYLFTCIPRISDRSMGKKPCRYFGTVRATKLGCGRQSVCGSTCSPVSVISLPREYGHTRLEVAGPSGKTCLEGTPKFFVFENASPGRPPLLLGGLLSLIKLVSFSQADERGRQFPTAHQLELCVSRCLRGAEYGTTTANIGERT